MDLGEFSVSAILASFIFGVFGMYLLRDGKKKMNFWFMGLGLGLMVYPYFVSGAWATWESASPVSPSPTKCETITRQ